MSSDGCQQVTWAGKAFPYLLHHPKDPSQTHSYGEARSAQAGGASTLYECSSLPSQSSSSDVKARAAAGTWNGAAPQGFLSRDQQGQRVAPAEPILQRPEPRDTIVGSGRMPLVGFGTNSADTEITQRALEAGFRLFDCASTYGNEPEIGAAFKEFLKDHKREELFITSKVWQDAHRPEAVKAACKQSIMDLGCDYLDLYLIHWPMAWKPGTKEIDPDVTLPETWAAMEALVDEGLVKQIGISNFSLQQIDEILASCRIRPVCHQVELHPLNAQRKLVGTCFRKGIVCSAYSPMGAGGADLRSHPVIQELAEKAGRTPAQITLKWNVQRGVPVMVRSKSTPHMKENLDLFGWKLNEYEKVKMDSINEDRRFITPSWAPPFADPEEGGVAKPSAVLGDGKQYK